MPGRLSLSPRSSAASNVAVSGAKPALASTAPYPGPPDGSPTSKPSPQRVRTVAPADPRPRPRKRSATSTITGEPPMVTRVARLTEVSDTAVKCQAALRKEDGYNTPLRSAVAG